MNERLGETRQMNCGLYATIIEYPKASCVTIQFEDGEIKKNVVYDNFKKGKVCHPSTKNRVGEIKKMSCGQYAKIIKYHKFNNITVEFEDGSIVEKTTYSAFKLGKIGHPKKKLMHVGEKNMMSCNLIAKIIVYRSYKDVDIRFEDGVIVRHTQYSSFKSGFVAHPKYKCVRTNHNGEEGIMHCGMKAKIIGYNKYHDITVQFEDGTIVEHRSYARFLDGYISNPSLRKSKISA